MAGDATRPSLVPSPSTTDPVLQRLIELGVPNQDARRILEEHLPSRVTDVLDALDRLTPRPDRDATDWVRNTLRRGHDPHELLTSQRRRRAIDRAWQRDAERREHADAEQEDGLRLTDAWAAAVSGALDDRLLTTAIERVTSPVPVLGRRSVPVAAAQLVRWAAGAHARAPDRPFADALLVDLERRTPSELEGPLPDVPPDATAGGDLTQRLTEALDRRPDLARPATPTTTVTPHPATDLHPQLDR